MLEDVGRGKGERNRNKQGRIHGNPVTDGWAGAVMRKWLAIQKCYGPTNRPNDTAMCRVSCPLLKREKERRWKKEKKRKPKRKKGRRKERVRE